MTSRVVVLLAPVLAVALGCADPQRTISLNSYRNAVSEGASKELAHRGVVLRERPRCFTPGEESAKRGGHLAVRCSASTVDGIPVFVTGATNHLGTARQTERYEIFIANQIAVRAPCLGESCRHA